MFPPQFFVKNRQTLLNAVGNNGIIAVTANGLMQRSGDSGFTFRQDSTFYYLTGLEEPQAVLIMDTETGEEFLILPPRTDVETYFGGEVDHAGITKISGLITICSHSEGWDRFKNLQRGRKKIYTLSAYPLQFTRQERMFTNPARRLLLQKLKRLSALPHEPINDQLIQMRMCKQPEEITALKAAIQVTKTGIARVQNKLAAGIFEYELEAELDYAFRLHNSRHGFMPPIVAAGKNTTILHYHTNNAQIQAGDSLLLDIGAEVHNYTADISRTFFIQQPTKRQQQVHDAVMRVHGFALSQLKHGLSWREWATSVDACMGEELIKLGLITKNSRSDVRRYFPHAIGHSLGLDAHDVCDYQTILADMVVTVEPGIYIPEEGLGIRIEDDVLVTKNGAMNLSADIPYAAAMVK